MNIERLNAYKENQHAVRLLEIEIQGMEAELKQLCEPSYVNARKLDGMPRGGSISNPTARMGTQLVEGYMPPEAVKLSLELDVKRAELQEKQLEVLYVDVWLDSLTGVERWVIQMHCIERYPWRIVSYKSREAFGDHRSECTLKRIKRKALARL